MPYSAQQDAGLSPSKEYEWISIPGTGVSRRFVTPVLVDEIERAVLDGHDIKRIASCYYISIYVVDVIYNRMLESAIRNECLKCNIYSSRRLSDKLIDVLLCFVRIGRLFRQVKLRKTNSSLPFKSNDFVTRLRHVLDNIHSNPFGVRLLKYYELLMLGIRTESIKSIENDYCTGVITMQEAIKRLLFLLDNYPLKLTLRRFVINEFISGLESIKCLERKSCLHYTERQVIDKGSYKS